VREPLYEAAKVILDQDGSVSSTEFRDAVEDALRYAGFTVEREVPCTYWGRAGRLDLWLSSGAWRCAVELGWRDVRAKSVAKVLECQADSILVTRCDSRTNQVEVQSFVYSSERWEKKRKKAEKHLKRIRNTLRQCLRYSG
jgi:hypothetical protein